MTQNDHIESLLPIFRPIAREFFAKAQEKGYDLKITESYRSNERQAELYALGRTKPGKIVTFAKPGESYHNQRRAFDVYDNKRGYNLNWEELGRLGESLGLVWGGRFPKLVDRPHFEYHGPEVVLQVVSAPKEGTYMFSSEQLFEVLYRALVSLFKSDVRIEDYNHAVGVWKGEYASRDPRECVVEIVKKQYGGELSPLYSVPVVGVEYEEIAGPLYRKKG